MLYCQKAQQGLELVKKSKKVEDMNEQNEAIKLASYGYVLIVFKFECSQMKPERGLRVLEEPVDVR
jgi:hypothetical protein